MTNAQSDPAGGPVWFGVEELPLEHCNHFFIQWLGNEFFLTLGSLQPLIGDQSGVVPIRPIARAAVSRERLEEFVDVATRMLADQASWASGEGRADPPGAS